MSPLDVSGLDIREALTEPGAWSSVYTDGPEGEPPGAVESRVRSLRDRMIEAGIPDADADALVAALIDGGEGRPAPSARWLLARDGRVRVDKGFSGPRRGPEQLAHAPFPEVVPLLRHRMDEREVLVVETGRDGADLSLQRLGRATIEVQHVEGEDHPVQADPGDWSQARTERKVAEVWQRHQSEVADEVERIVREHRPEHVFITGDAQARGLLLQSMSPDSLALVVEIDVETRADGADDTALVEAIDRTVAAAHEDRIAAVRDRAAERDAENGAVGTAAVVGALQQAQVDTLLLDALMIDDDATLLALPAVPWVAVSAADAFEAGAGTPVPAVEALARAAILTDAEVLFIEEDPDDEEPRSERIVQAPLAALRWPEAPVAGGAPAAADDGHPSQAEGEDPDDPSGRPDPAAEGHPSQAEGE